MKKDLPDTPLMRAFDLARRVIDGRNTIPIINNFLLTANRGTLTVGSTDLDAEVSVQVNIGGDAAFTTTASAEMLHRICAHHGGGLAFAAHPALLHVTAGDCLYRLSRLDAEDFPRLQQWTPEVSFSLDGADLLADLKAVRNGISQEATRYYLNGVYWHSAGTMPTDMRFAATDGHRLFVVKRPIPLGVERLPGLIIPLRVVGLLIAALEIPWESDAVEVAMSAEPSGGRVRFIVGDVTVNAKCIDGTYPDYSRVIPGKSDGTLTVPAARLAECAKSAGLIMAERTRALALNFGKPGKPPTITAKSPETGTVEMPLPGVIGGKPPETVGLNTSYLTDSLAPFGDALVSIGFEDAHAPVLFTAENCAAARLTVVQMPMRVS